MPSSSGARLAGDDFQHFFAWKCALELKNPSLMVESVTVEDAKAFSADDVTVRHYATSTWPDTFYQIKYHVDHRDQYSTDRLTMKVDNGASQLEKFYRSYLGLSGAAKNGRDVRIVLLSNWVWSPNDAFGACISGTDYSIKEEFLTKGPRSDIGKVRKQWLTHLKIDEAELAKFVKTLRFKLGYGCAEEVEDMVAEKMASMGLGSDLQHLKVAVSIVRDWVKQGRQQVTEAELDEEIAKYQLAASETVDKFSVIAMNTILSPRLEVEPDFLLDWSDLFQGEPGKKGHQLLDPSGWNSRLLPELKATQNSIFSNTTKRLIRARGASRLASWLAFGFVFSEAAGYTIEFDQRGALWRTDALPSPNFSMVAPDPEGTNGETRSGPPAVVAVAVSVTHDITEDVKSHLACTADVGALLSLAPSGGTGDKIIRNPSELVKFAQDCKTAIRKFARARQATQVKLYYCGPASGACFLGHRLNATAAEFVIMEDSGTGYFPTFTLS